MLVGIFLTNFDDMLKYTLTKIYIATLAITHTSSLPHGHLTTMSLFDQILAQKSTKVGAPRVEVKKSFWHIY
jgi:hypothetical protein